MSEHPASAEAAITPSVATRAEIFLAHRDTGASYNRQIGDIPVLGALFSSKAYQKNESDLVIIVTPRIVQPIRPGLPVRTPLDNTLPPNDIDLFVMGKGEIARKNMPPGPPERPFVGHMLDLPPMGGALVSMR